MFVLFALILEQFLHSLVLRPAVDGSIWLTSQPLLYVLYGILAAGIFEETARFIAFHVLKKKYDGVGVGLAYGIGHGGIEVIILLGFVMLNNLLFSLLINTGQAAALGDSEPIVTAIATLTSTDSWVFLIGGVERISAITAQISLSLLVWMAVSQKKLGLFALAIALHAAFDLPAALAQVGVLSGAVLLDILMIIEALALAMIVFFIYKKLMLSIPARKAIKGESIKGEVLEGEVLEGEVLEGEVLEGEVLEGEALKQEHNQNQSSEEVQSSKEMK
jgi:uncharacterized membrane protein YhfC